MHMYRKKEYAVASSKYDKDMKDYTTALHAYNTQLDGIAGGAVGAAQSPTKPTEPQKPKEIDELYDAGSA